MEKLLAADIKDLQKAGVIDLGMEKDLGDDIDDEAKALIEQAKEGVLNELQKGARSYAEQFKKHVEAAQAKAAEEQLLITRAAKKRKSEQEVAAPAGQAQEAPQAETPNGEGGEAPKAAPAPTTTTTPGEDVLERLRAQKAAEANGSAAASSGSAAKPPAAY